MRLLASTLITVAEVDPFPARAASVGLSEQERQALTLSLAQYPKAGDVIPGTGGLRKLRWAGKGKGKSGGYRMIYYFFNEALPVYLLAIYPKNQQIDLTPQQKKLLTALGSELKAQALKRTTQRRAR